jgi:hypothetical protein
MTNRSSIHFRIAGVAVLALSAIVFAKAPQYPQGQYHFQYPPLANSGVLSAGNLATYSPIKSIDGNTIQLRGDDGVVYLISLTAETIYCQGGTKVSDWIYLTSVPKKASVTVLSKDAENMTALVIWDTGPTLTTDNGKISVILPPLCK